VKAMIETFFAALSFLTRVRAPRGVAFSPEMLERSVAFFPVVGVLVGLWGAALYEIAQIGWPVSVAAVMSIFGTIWLTGGMHEDAFADTCDAFGGGSDPQAILRIMKDSRVGAYGALGTATMVLARSTAIVAVAHVGVATVLKSIVVAHVLARWSSVPLMWQCRYVRGNDSKSRAVTMNASPAKVAATTTVACAIVLSVAGGKSMVAMIVAAFITTAGSRYFNRRLGGITGDCLGAVNQVVELTSYLSFGWQTAIHGSGR